MSKEFVEKNENVEKGLKILNDYFTNNKVVSIKLVNCSYTVKSYKKIYPDDTGNSGDIKNKTTLFNYSVKFEQNFGVLYIEISEADDTLKINTIKITQTEKPVGETYNFYGHNIFGFRLFLLLLVILLNGFVMYSEYDYLKKAARPKIWLQIAMVISVISIDVNWTSMLTDIKLLQVSLFPVSYRFGIATDSHLIYYLPVMAILYWAVFRKRETSNGKTDDTQNSAPVT